MRMAPSSHSQSSESRAGGADGRKCLLCDGTDCAVADQFDCADLRKAWSALGVEFSAHVWSAINGRPALELFECQACGFRFCDPRLAGDGRFYDELDRQRTSYYPADVPEFSRSLAWAKVRGLRTVLDVGCGDGAFLDLAREAGLGAVGVELNVKAAEECQRKGHEVFTSPLSELAGDTRGPRYDLVTLFQVLEHVPDPAEFLSQAADLLRPGGFVAVAVPNDRGIYRICPREPHEWPPHHISRWRQKDLRNLAQRAGLQVARTGANRLLGGEAEHFWGLHNKIAAKLGAAPHPGGTFLPRVLSFFYRKLGLKFIVPGLGTSIYAFYQRQ